MGDREIRKRPGYGSDIRRHLEQKGWTQAELASRSEVSRQTISRAINHDEVSDRTVQLVAAALGHVPEPGPRSSPAKPAGKDGAERRPATASTLCDASDLVAWADRREAQALLPKVVRRLVLATGNQVTAASFRADEGVQLSGWDGITRADRAAPFVPGGPAGWEMSVGTQPKTKAQEDLDNRTGKPGPLQPSETAFVFVTLRRWQDKDAWGKEQTEAGPWKEVRVLDADDLAAWLETAPAVHTWLSLLVGTTPKGATDLESYWDAWSGATTPPIPSDLLLARREEDASKISERLGEAHQPFAIRAESRSESIAVLFAVLTSLPEEEAETVLARAVVVESREAFRRLAAFTSPLILIPAFHAEELATVAARAGHTVVVPLGESDPQESGTIQLSPLSRRSAAEVLESIGMDSDRANQLAGLARRSLTAFRRAIASSPGLRQPEWAKPAAGRSLLPALLAGSWNDGKLRDREILAALGRRPYEELRDDLIEWSSGADPAVRRRGDAWYLVSREDAWRLLSTYLTSDDLERFEEAVVSILASANPSFDLPVDQRWMAGALGHSAEHSALLARGLAETVCIMGARGEGVPSAGLSAQDTAVRIAGRLLAAANEDWKVWASLSPHLSRIAEAAPDAFLDGVEDGLEGEEPILGRLFTDEKDSMFGSSPHTGLLWAMETLAWSVPHLGRVVHLLAKLDRIDPGSALREEENRTGRLANRPLASLKAIFRSWLPETSADLDARLEALDLLRSSQPEVAWAVMLSMLPEQHATALRSSRPAFRDWAVDARHTVTYGELARTTKEVVERLRTDAGCDGDRWADIIDHLDAIPPDPHNAIVEDLYILDPEQLERESSVAIWTALREVVSRHRAYRSAKWAMPEEYVQRLENLLPRYAPSDPTALHGWLFDHDPHLPDGTDVLETPLEERREALMAERLRAVEELLSDEGVEVLIELGNNVEDPMSLGYAAGSTDVSLRYTDDILSLLGDPNQALRNLAHGYAVARQQAADEDWVREQINRGGLDLSPHQQAALLYVLPGTPDTWRLAEECGESTRTAYWQGIGIHRISHEHLAGASDALVEVGRPFAAVELVAMGRRGDSRPSPDLATRVLEAAIEAGPDADRPGNHFGYAVGELLESLYEAELQESRIARIEWALLPALDRHRRPPKALHSLLAEDPSFFVEVLSLVYRGEEEEPAELTPENRQRARVGHSLLDDWRRVPGQQDSGRVDAEHLRNWITEARNLLRDAGRSAIGLHVIGQVFSGSPSDPDGSWPCTPVREIIEEVASTDLEEGLRIGVYNSRGVVTRDPTAGGAQERALAEKYEGLSAAVANSHPRTARVLREIAGGYRRDARREDLESEMVEDLGI